VSASICRALAPASHLEVWRHNSRWLNGLRQLGLLYRAVLGSFNPPGLIIYTHVDLARVSLLPRLRTVPYAVLIYGVESWRPFDPIRRRAIEGAALTIAISSYSARRAMEANPWLPEPRVVWLGVEVPSLEFTAETKNVVLVGRMARVERYKGHDAVIQAWPLILDRVPSATLTVIGDGDDRERLEQLAEGIHGVHFAGFVTDAERIRLVRSAAALLNLSRGEGFGLAAVEAASLGTPIVALSNTVTEELFPSGVGHILLQEEDPNAVSDAVVYLIENDQERRRIGSEGKRRVDEMFTQSHFASRFRAALSSCVQVNPSDQQSQ